MLNDYTICRTYTTNISTTYMKRASLLSYALVIWGIFRSIFLSFFFLSVSPTLFLSVKSIVCLEWSGWSVSLCSLWSEQLQSLLAVELTDIGKGKERGGTAHRKSTKLNINPGCRERMALATEDKEGHCLFLWVQGCILRRGGGHNITFLFVNCITGVVFCNCGNSGV